MEILSNLHFDGLTIGAMMYAMLAASFVIASEFRNKNRNVCTRKGCQR